LLIARFKIAYIYLITSLMVLFKALCPKVNLTRRVGTTYTVSSYLSVSFQCEYAINGIIAQGGNNEWVSKGEKEGI